MIETSLLFAPAVPLAIAGISALGGLAGALSARRAERNAKNQQRNERKEMRRLERAYANIDTSNPYLNMENTMEDLTINQQQAQFQAQQNQQAQANTLNALRGAAGSSGIASLAQVMAQQGQLAAQQASASIGQQEATNQRLAAQQAGRIQSMERQGELISRQQQRDQTGTLLGMAQSRVAAARQQQMMAQQSKFNAISGGAQGVISAGLVGMDAGFFDDYL